MVLMVNVGKNECTEDILQQQNCIKRDKQPSDFIVNIDGNEFHVRRGILSAGSDSFNAMLTHDTKESQLGKVEMRDVDPECVKICNDYIYTGKAEIPNEKIEQLIHVARLIKLELLISAIVTEIEDSLDVHTFFIARRIAELYEIKSLSDKCIKYLNENVLAISSQPSFQDEEKKFVEEIFSSQNVSLAENEKLVVLLRWVGKDLAKKDDLISLLKRIKLQQVTPDYLRHLLDNDPLIQNDLSLFKIFSAALLDRLKVTSQKIDINSESKYILLLESRLKLFQYFSPITHEVKVYRKTSIPGSLEISVVSLDSYLYVFYFCKKVSRLKFRHRNATWERLADTLKNHDLAPPVISLQGSLFVIGSDRPSRTTAVEKFTPTKNQWDQMLKRPLAVHDACLASSGDFIYSLGGVTHSNVSDSFLRFDPKCNKWTKLEPMLQPRLHSSAVVIAQKLYVIGGVTENKRSCNTMDCYNLQTKQWNRQSVMTGCYSLVDAHHVDGWIFVAQRYTDPFSIVNYNIEKDEWHEIQIKGRAAFDLSHSVLF